MSEAEEREVAAWFAGWAERKIETSCARVFLDRDAAFKVKRRVEFGFLDYTTLEKRLWALERELAFNRAAAPDIYRAVRAITRSATGLELDGAGPIVDYALEMRRFDDAAVLAAQPWALDGAMAEALGRTVARFHAAAPSRPEGGRRAMEFTIGSNAKLLRDLSPKFGEDRIERLIALTQAEFARQAELLGLRTQGGFARHSHGDLHLGNILIEHGRPVLFDCIEFNDLLSDIDVQYDLAFLLMDLAFRRRSDAAVRVLSAYLDEAAPHLPAGLWEGLAALPLMLSVRASVRAHVWAHSGDDAAAGAYVDAAIAHLSPAAPVLAAVGGLSGTGKSSFARLIAPGLGPEPGAVILRTDEIRKGLLGVAVGETAPPQAYGDDVTAQVYAEMFRRAALLLKAGRGVLLDATFLDPGFRDRAGRLAAEAGVAFHGIWLEAPDAVRASRIAGRVADVSDATPALAARQAGRDPGPMAWPTVDASGPVEAQAAIWGTNRRR